MLIIRWICTYNKITHMCNIRVQHHRYSYIVA